MKTFFQWEVLKISDNRSLVMSGDDTKELAEQNAKKSANYYITECQYEVRIEIKEVCATCYNGGIVRIPHKRNKLISTKKVCPECKGKCPNNTYNI